jgi:hypothetical protein
MKRPDMDSIEKNFQIFQRPSAEQSREMADYIYELEKKVLTAYEEGREKGFEAGQASMLIQ